MFKKIGKMEKRKKFTRKQKTTNTKKNLLNKTQKKGEKKKIYLELGRIQQIQRRIPHDKFLEQDPEEVDNDENASDLLGVTISAKFLQETVRQTESAMDKEENKWSLFTALHRERKEGRIGE